MNTGGKKWGGVNRQAFERGKNNNGKLSPRYLLEEENSPTVTNSEKLPTG